ncbi:MAG: YihY/virulence factor BrkB family protein [Anaerolineae bacterium]|nr:YihY/virulence factor BrkB family protein [Anaerolineae bacterium]
MEKLKIGFALLRHTFKEWNEDQGPRLSAALAYYTAFSLAPLLVVIIAILGFIVNQDTIQAEVLRAVRSTAGQDAASFVNELIVNSNKPAEGIISTVIGIVTLILGAAGAFGQLQDALNIIWNVKSSEIKTGIISQIKNKVLSFGMVLFVGFLLLVSLVITTILAALNSYMVGLLPGTEFLLQLVGFITTYGVTVLLFALIFKFLPHIEIEWRDVWIGAAITGLLFSLGRLLLGWYLGRFSPVSAYGAAGSFVLILLWIYYSAQIVLFGAEFTQVYTRRFGSHGDPVKKTQIQVEAAVPIDADARQAIPAGGTAFQAQSQVEQATETRRKDIVPGIIFAVGMFISALVAGLFQRDSTPEKTTPKKP